MSQERVIFLGTVSIEKTAAQNLDFFELVKSFTDVKASETTFVEALCKHTLFRTLHFPIYNAIKFYRCIYLLRLLRAR
jgi:hypothetical protein